MSKHNPDILTCLANLSNDEVFTSPKVANNILENLPLEIWSNPEAKFLDPACKSGVFLREITKRLINGLEKKIPNMEERVNHILKKQIFGLPITKLTSYISKRTLYLSKHANGKFSIAEFEDEDGNLKYIEKEHTWEAWASGTKCKYCGVKRDVYFRDKQLESYAYSFIHNDSPEDLFNMKFDVIIGNPPYQMSTGGSGAQAIPIYDKFVETAIKLKPRFISMIIPSRWFSGGMGLSDFRKKMLNDKRIRIMVDYQNSKECFPDNSISGGVNYFLWDRDNEGECTFTSNYGNKTHVRKRSLSEFNFLIRDNIGLEIIRKIKSKDKESLEKEVTSINPFDIKTSFRGNKDSFQNSVKVFHSKGYGYMRNDFLKNNLNLVNKYKVMLSQTTSEHAGEPSKEGNFKLFAKLQVLNPGEVSTHSYLIIGNYEEKMYADNLSKYLKTKFARFLVLQTISSIHITKSNFMFLPKQDFSLQFDDHFLYEKYNLSLSEIDHIETLIKPMF